MSRLVLLFIGYSNLLYGQPICTEEQKKTTKLLEEIYLFPEPDDRKVITSEQVIYLFDGKEISDDNKVITKSQQYIECHPDSYQDSLYAFDKPLPDGWLYPPPFNENSRYWKKHFDTGQNEYWVFPNVHCDKDTRRLTAMSWMRSGTHESHKSNKGMHSKFKNNTPPFATANTTDGSVYCGWSGWLYPTDDHNYEKWFDTEDDEAFTIVNVYCRNNRVVFLSKKVGGNIGIAGKSGTPFKSTDTAPLEKNENWVHCDWQGWLYKAKLLNDTWIDGDKGERWTYERYFIISNNTIGEKKKKRDDNKGAIHGRVMNPYCSQAKSSSKIGVVTAIRAYCFYPDNVPRGNKWYREKKSMCDDLK